METRPRIDVIDALRGSAVVGLLLMHSIAHWGCERYPESSSVPALDDFAYHIGIFLFLGKPYLIFALTFGVSASMLLDRWSKRGVEFRGPFLWRLTVLAVFGYVHGIVYGGDVLLTFAVLGIPLVFLYPLADRVLAWISVALFLQFPLLWETGRVLLEHGYEPTEPHHWALYGQLTEVYARGSFLDVSAANVGKGQLAKFWWTVETGRYMQIIGMFVCGLLTGRSRIVEDAARSVALAKRALLWGLLLLPAIELLRVAGGPRGYAIDVLLSSYGNLAQVGVWVGLFVLLYRWDKTGAALRLLVPCGRMSLTCYVMQSLVGVPLFYGYGLALYRDLGPFHSMLVGIAIFVVQCVFAHLWLKRFGSGPLERLWRSLSFA